MATFNLGSGTDLNNLDDISKVKSYLFQLTEQLRYMFNNLDPQENYSEKARLIMVTDGERQASIEANLDAVRLNYVSKDGIVSAINLSEELIQIEASKIKLEGMVTVNGNFKVGLDGSIEAVNGKFSGDITASTITGSTFQLNRGASVGFIADGDTFQLGDFVVNDWYGRQILESTDEVTGMSGEPEEEGGYYLWAGWYGDDNRVVFCAKNDGSVRVNGVFYYNGRSLDEIFSSLEYYDGDPSEDPDPTEGSETYTPDGRPDPGYIDSGPGAGL